MLPGKTSGRPTQCVQPLVSSRDPSVLYLVSSPDASFCSAFQAHAVAACDVSEQGTYEPRDDLARSDIDRRIAAFTTTEGTTNLTVTGRPDPATVTCLVGEFTRLSDRASTPSSSAEDVVVGALGLAGVMATLAMCGISAPAIRAWNARRRRRIRVEPDIALMALPAAAAAAAAATAITTTTTATAAARPPVTGAAAPTQRIG